MRRERFRRVVCALVSTNERLMTSRVKSVNIVCRVNRILITILQSFRFGASVCLPEEMPASPLKMPSSAKLTRTRGRASSNNISYYRVVVQIQKRMGSFEIHHRDTEDAEEAQRLILCASSASSVSAVVNFNLSLSQFQPEPLRIIESPGLGAQQALAQAENSFPVP